jgi:hypothetical protein
MLWDGTQPDGSDGHPPLRRDITCWHNYEDYGSLLNMSMDYQKPQTNVLDHLRSKFGRPIIISEWNGRASDTDAQRAIWAAEFLTDMHLWRELFDIQAVMVYQLFNGSPWGVLNPDGSIQQTFGQTVAAFIGANPV